MVHPLSPPGTILIYSKIGCKYNRRSGILGGITNLRYIHTDRVNNMHTYYILTEKLVCGQHFVWHLCDKGRCESNEQGHMHVPTIGGVIERPPPLQINMQIINIIILLLL